MRWRHWGSDPGPWIPTLSCRHVSSVPAFRDHPGEQSSFTEKCPSSCAGKGQALGRRAEAAPPWLSVNLTVILLRTRTSGATPLTSSGPSASSRGPGLVCLPFEKALRATNACWAWKCTNNTVACRAFLPLKFYEQEPDASVLGPLTVGK